MKEYPLNPQKKNIGNQIATLTVERDRLVNERNRALAERDHYMNERTMLVRVFKHTHVRDQTRSTDACAECGLDLRHDIHRQWRELGEG